MKIDQPLSKRHGIGWLCRLTLRIVCTGFYYLGDMLDGGGGANSASVVMVRGCLLSKVYGIDQPTQNRNITETRRQALCEVRVNIMLHW